VYEATNETGSLEPPLREVSDDEKVIIYNQKGNPSPATRPGPDDGVSGTLLPPEEGVPNQLGRPVQDGDLYFEVDVGKVRAAGGTVVEDGGRIVRDAQGQPIVDPATGKPRIYPRGHVSIRLPGQSKNERERRLANEGYLSDPKQVPR
jgi:hypothetical protein